jgi:DNA-binding transcriptional regulator YhcF (GntR family)
MDTGRPIFQQIADLIENSIIDGTLAEEAQVPSTNELAAFHRINPATAAKGVSQLADDGTIYKRRGIGMFVATGARDRLRLRRREQFAAQYLHPLLAEADKLGIGVEELKKMIDALTDET